MDDRLEIYRGAKHHRSKITGLRPITSEVSSWAFLFTFSAIHICEVVDAIGPT